MLVVGRAAVAHAVITEVMKHPGNRNGRQGAGGLEKSMWKEISAESVWRAAQVSQPKKQIKINKRQVLNDTDYDIKKGCH